VSDEEVEFEVTGVRVLPPLRPGSILHIHLGIRDMGDGMPPFIPSSDDIYATKHDWEKLVPADVKVHVSHFGEVVADIIEVDADGTR
jgi:hypothetical protein